jgi:hypothetical protein
MTIAHTSRDVRAQAFAQPSERDGAVLLLLEDSDAHQKTDRAAEGWRMCSGGFRELLEMPGTVREQLGEPQFRGKTERARDVVSGREMVQHDLRRWLRLRAFRCHIVPELAWLAGG